MIVTAETREVTNWRRKCQQEINHWQIDRAMLGKDEGWLDDYVHQEELDYLRRRYREAQREAQRQFGAMPGWNTMKALADLFSGVAK